MVKKEIIGYLFLALFAVFLLWYVKKLLTQAGSGLLTGLGFKDSEEDKEIEKAAENLTITAFSPNFYKTAMAKKIKIIGELKYEKV